MHVIPWITSTYRCPIRSCLDMMTFIKHMIDYTNITAVISHETPPKHAWCPMNYIDGSVQDCSNSSALALELLQSCRKPSIWTYRCAISSCLDVLSFIEYMIDNMSITAVILHRKTHQNIYTIPRIMQSGTIIRWSILEIHNRHPIACLEGWDIGYISWVQSYSLCCCIHYHVDELVHERNNSSALAMELCLCYINPWVLCWAVLLHHPCECTYRCYRGSHCSYWAAISTLCTEMTS